MKSIKYIIRPISYIGLALTLLPCFFVFSGHLDLDSYKKIILAGTAIWIFTAPFWINK